MDNEEKNIRVIIGLGNPDTKYSKTRHNIGFRIIDLLADEFGGSWSSSVDREQTDVMINNKKVTLIKPLTYMNNSGKVIPQLSKKGIKVAEILVIHDELEKRFGSISIKIGGSARGHNGLRSIIDFIGKDFWRLRFGIGRPDSQDIGDYVLTNFSPGEELQMEQLLAEAISSLLNHLSG